MIQGWCYKEAIDLKTYVFFLDSFVIAVDEMLSDVMVRDKDAIALMRQPPGILAPYCNMIKTKDAISEIKYFLNLVNWICSERLSVFLITFCDKDKSAIAEMSWPGIPAPYL